MEEKENKENLVNAGNLNAGNLGNSDSGLPAQDKEAAASADTLPDNYLVDDPTLDIEDDEENRRRFIITPRMIKLGTALVFSLMILIIASIAWFAMNKESGTSGMGVKSQSLPYVIQTRGNSGYYEDKRAMTGSDAMEWKISAEYNFNNYKESSGSEETEPESEPESEPGLEPGASGKLEFRVSPNASDSITVDCVFDIKIYAETVVLDENNIPVKDDNNKPVTEITEINDTALKNYVKAHIMLFTEYNSETKKYSGLITTDEDFKRTIERTYSSSNEDYTTIYWIWPMYLYELTSEDEGKIIYAPSEREDVINYIAENRSGFFKDCNDEEGRVRDDLMALSEAYDNSIFNRYNMKYDNADLEIGNNVSYVMLSMNVKQ